MKKFVTTELTYLEKYPMNYYIGPSDKDIQQLEKRIKKHEQKLKVKNKNEKNCN